MASATLPDELCRNLASKVRPAVTSTRTAALTMRTKIDELAARHRPRLGHVHRGLEALPDRGHHPRRGPREEDEADQPDGAHRRCDRRDRVLDVFACRPGRRGANRRSCSRRRREPSRSGERGRRSRRERSRAARSRTERDTRFPPTAACSDPRRTVAAPPAAPGRAWSRSQRASAGSGKPAIRPTGCRSRVSRAGRSALPGLHTSPRALVPSAA